MHFVLKMSSRPKDLTVSQPMEDDVFCVTDVEKGNPQNLDSRSVHMTSVAVSPLSQ